MITRRRAVGGAAATVLSGLTSRSFAQAINANARIVVGFPSGGSTDVVAHLLAEHMRGVYAPQISVENRTGGSGRVGAELVKNGPADGTQMLLTPDSILTLYPHVYTRLSYDTLRDFTPVAPVGTVAFGLSVGPAVPGSVKSLTDYFKWVKSDRRNSAYASPAAGAAPHFVGLMLGRAAGVDLYHVAYDGGASSLQDLMRGQVPASISVLSELIPQLASGKLRVLATSGAQRSPFLPDVPTFAEQGFKDATAQEVFGLFVPSKTAPDVVAKLNAAVREVVAKKAFADAMAKLSYELASATPTDFASAVKAEIDRWAAVVKASGFDRYVPQPEASTF